MPETFLWHDYETFGTDARRDRPSQFAAVRTDENFKVIEEPLILYCAPADDVLPHPDACLITGITPQKARRLGQVEADFATAIWDAMSTPATCSVGYNSYRFDDEFSRFLFYRNYFPPYAREYENGNSRWDLIDLVRHCYALRPQGLEWPLRPDGQPSFRLEQLSVANGIEHHDAHDALADVHATIALARRLRRHQPRLLDWALSLRSTARVNELIDPAAGTIYVHSSSRIPAERGCTSLFMSLCWHPEFGKQAITVDLMADPGMLIEGSSADIQDRVFVGNADLPEGEQRIPLKTIRANRAPMVAPAAVIRGVDLNRIGLDPDRCRRHADLIRRHQDVIRQKLQDIFRRPDPTPAEDPESALYEGFLPDADKRLMQRVRRSAPDDLCAERFPFQDSRLGQMLVRYRARNWPDSLDAAQRRIWDEWRYQRIIEGRGASIHLQAFQSRVSALRGELGADTTVDSEQLRRQLDILDQLEAWPLELHLPDTSSTPSSQEAGTAGTQPTG